MAKIAGGKLGIPIKLFLKNSALDIYHYDVHIFELLSGYEFTSSENKSLKRKIFNSMKENLPKKYQCICYNSEMTAYTVKCLPSALIDKIHNCLHDIELENGTVKTYKIFLKSKLVNHESLKKLLSEGKLDNDISNSSTTSLAAEITECRENEDSLDFTETSRSTSLSKTLDPSTSELSICELYKVITRNVPQPPDGNTYKNLSNPRGHVYIFNNTFQNDPNLFRPGANCDSNNLQYVFESMGYRVYIYNDLTKEETFQKVDEIQSEKELENIDSFIIVILSHGEDSQHFYASDMKLIHLDDIRYKFIDGKCPQLRDKGKIFMCNYCRGNIKQKHLQTDAPQNYPENEAPKDMVTLHASIDGFKAVRDSSKGTIFVQSLCETLSKHAHNMEFRLLYRNLYNIMKEKFGTTPELQYYVFKDFHFNPTTTASALQENQVTTIAEMADLCSSESDECSDPSVVEWYQSSMCKSDNSIDLDDWYSSAGLSNDSDQSSICGSDANIDLDECFSPVGSSHDSDQSTICGSDDNIDLGENFSPAETSHDSVIEIESNKRPLEDMFSLRSPKRPKSDIYHIEKMPNNEVEDQYTKYGSHIASQLRELPVVKFLELQEKFQSIITQERIASLSPSHP